MTHTMIVAHLVGMASLSASSGGKLQAHSQDTVRRQPQLPFLCYPM